MANEATKRNPLARVKPEPPASYVGDLGGTARKRRKDATGRKSDYHQKTQALSVRVPNEMADQVKALAAGEGVTVNAWLFQLIERALAE